MKVYICECGHRPDQHANGACTGTLADIYDQDYAMAVMIVDGEDGDEPCSCRAYVADLVNGPLTV